MAPFEKDLGLPQPVTASGGSSETPPASGLQPIARTQEVKLTAGEQAALMDRLDMPDLIASALTDVAEGDEPPVLESSEIVEERARILGRLIGGEARTIPANLGELDCAVIVEAIEGMTWLAIVSDEPALHSGRRRVVNSLVDKLVAAGIATEIDIPSA